MKRTLILITLVLALSAFPALAQDGTHTVGFDGFSFQLDPALAANVVIRQYPGDPVDLEQPGGPEPPYTQFVLFNEYPASDSFLDGVGSVRVYNTADFATYTAYGEQMTALQAILTERPDLVAYTEVRESATENALPFIPIFPAGQIIRARPHYIESDAVQGIGYVTVYRQDASPFMSNEFLYTFQGVSKDGAHYVMALLRFNAPMFPAEFPADFDYEAFIAGINDYFAESVSKLEAAAPTDFTPALTTLDTLVGSMQFGQ